MVVQLFLVSCGCVFRTSPKAKGQAAPEAAPAAGAPVAEAPLALEDGEAELSDCEAEHSSKRALEREIEALLSDSEAEVTVHFCSIRFVFVSFVLIVEFPNT